MSKQPDQNVGGSDRAWNAEAMPVQSETAGLDKLGPDRLIEERPEPQPSFELYTVLDLAGEGSFGKVYRCRSKDGRQTVAIKVPKDSDEAIALFEDEIAVVEAMSFHPNVVRVISRTKADFPNGNSRSALVMEWVPDATPIDVYCERYKLSRSARLALLLEVAKGLEHLHRAGVTHRDIKPRNVLVGIDGQPIIVDLGGALCRMASINPPPVLTIAYASPEQLRGVEPEAINQESDVYSFARLMGAVLLRRTINDLPRNESRPDLMRRMSEWDPQEYRRQPNWPLDAVGDLMDRMLHRTPRERPASAVVLAELKEIAQPALRRAARAAARVIGFRPLHLALIALVASIIGIVFSITLCAAYVRHPIGKPLTFPVRPLESMDDVIIVAIQDPARIERALSMVAYPMPPLNGRDRLRHLVAEIIRKAHVGGAAVTCLDLDLPSAPEAPNGTRAIAEAMRAARGTMPVVVGTKEHWVTQPTEEVIDPLLIDEVAGVACFDAYIPKWRDPITKAELPVTDPLLRVPVVIEREGRAASFGFAAWAAACFHRAEPAVSHPLRPFSSRVAEFLPGWEATGRIPARSCELDHTERVAPPPPDEKLSQGVKVGDEMSLLLFDADRMIELCESRMLPVDELLSLSDQLLHDRLGDKVVLVWYGESDVLGRKDWLEVKPSELQPGAWLHAMAIQSLISLPPFSPSTETLLVLMSLITLGLAIGGIGVGTWAYRAVIWNWRWPAAAVAGFVGVAVLIPFIAPEAIRDFRVAVILVAAAISLTFASLIQFVRLAVRAQG